MDACRVGHRPELPSGLLAAAAPGYLTGAQRERLGVRWVEQALGHASSLGRGTGPLTGVGGAVGRSGTGWPVYRLADCLAELGALSRAGWPVPVLLWEALLVHGARADLARIGTDAERRGLYRLADTMYGAAVQAGRGEAVEPAAALLHRLRRTDEAIAWLQTRARAGDADAVRIAARLLQQTGRS
jgi:hypothetical protein